MPTSMSCGISIIMAYRADGGMRDLHRVWIEKHYKAMLPNVEIVIVEDKSGDKGWGTFNKSKMLNDGVEKAKGDILFMTDIDMVFVKNKLLVAFEQAYNYSIIFPMNNVYFAGKTQTMKIMKTVRDWTFPKIDVTVTHCKSREGRQANGSYIVTRGSYYKAGGHDERFVDWGSEDSAFIKAVSTMVDLPYLRVIGDSIHLYHPTNKDRFKKRDSSIKADFYKQYFEALDNKERMKEVIRGSS